MYKAVFGCFLFALFCTAKRLEAQHTISIKAYSNLAIGKSVSIPNFEPINNIAYLDYRWPSLAIKYLYDNNRFDEFELTNWVIQKLPDYATDSRFGIGFRYQHGWRMTKRLNAPMAFGLGYSLRAAYALVQLNEQNILGFPAENEFYSLSLGFHPQLEFLVKGHLVFEISPVVDLANFAVRSEYVYDEFIDEEQRSSIDFYTRYFQVFLRIGAGWRF